MESIVIPLTWEDIRLETREFFQALRSPAGEEVVLERNLVVETLLARGVLRTLTGEEMAAYRQPFADPGEGRRPTLSWPRQIPIGGEPTAVAGIVEAYGEWLARSPVPKLFINAEPGVLLTGRAREFCRTWPTRRKSASPACISSRKTAPPGSARRSPRSCGRSAVPDEIPASSQSRKALGSLERLTIVTTPVVVITGALTGIGRATAVAFAREGAKVVVSGRNRDAGESLAAELRALAGEAGFIRADVRHEEDLEELVDGTVRRFGRLDVAVNNAGTDQPAGPISKLTPEDYAAVFDTNVLGTLLSMKHQFRVMQARGTGAIVNLSSVYGQKGAPGGSLYSASKHAVIGLARSAALEGAALGIRVNAVSPGPVDTAMFDRVMGGSEEAKTAARAYIPQHRVARPEEIADAVLFLASGRASNLTGQAIVVDGGLTAQ
jgi:NAD(P)-dependent dehydrogenase (short-subunit alcohol dehydrogenase family)